MGTESRSQDFREYTFFRFCANEECRERFQPTGKTQKKCEKCKKDNKQCKK